MAANYSLYLTTAKSSLKRTMRASTVARNHLRRDALMEPETVKRAACGRSAAPTDARGVATVADFIPTLAAKPTFDRVLRGAKGTVNRIRGGPRR
jgi:hypothetical protein